MTPPPDISAEKVEAFITRWQGQEGGQERANYGMFLTELVRGTQPAAAQPVRRDA